ncbi:WD40 repeat domain-containing protein [Anoxybacillus kestanbolensis]|uniref:WD40 repeat domain-containing protein n=1 Tax=Anoxybacillus kestanbolensis TaxID=227476 RepID=UPI003D1AA880
MCLSPVEDGIHYAVADFFNLYIRSFGESEPLHSLKFNDYINSIAFHPDEPVFMVGCGDGYLREIDYRTGTIVAEVDLQRPISSLKFTKKGDFLGIVCAETVFLLNWEEHTIYEYNSFGEQVYGIDFSESGHELVVGFGNKVQTFFFNIDHSGVKFEVGYENHKAYAVAYSGFSPDIAVAAGTTLKIYDIVDKKFVFEYEAMHQVQYIEWFDKGKYLAFSSRDGVTILEADTYKEVQSFVPRAFVFGVSDDGSKLICGSRNTPTYIWSK